MSDAGQGDKVVVVECHNAWCSGSMHVATLEGEPPERYPCPICGWIALPGSGIRFPPPCVDGAFTTEP